MGAAQQPPEAERKPRLLPIAAAALPLAAIVVMVVGYLRVDVLGDFQSAPPAEAVTVERTVLRPGSIELTVRNDGPTPVTVAQILVNDAYRQFVLDRTTLPRLGTGSVVVDYPWDPGLPLTITLITSTGVTHEHHIDVAAETPRMSGAAVLRYAVVGVLIGVVPVAIGMMWFPLLRRSGRAVITFALAITVGMLTWLLMDTVSAGAGLARATPGALNGLGILVGGALIATTGPVFVERVVARRVSLRGSTGLATAYLLALGIGLHNLGEGLAVGTAVATGEIALGQVLLIGFAVHNTTEGFAIAAPLADQSSRPRWHHLVWLTALAGAPTILGAWGGGALVTPAWATFAFGLAAGAVLQVLVIVGGQVLRRSEQMGVVAAGVVGGFAVMYVTALLTA